MTHAIDILKSSLRSEVEAFKDATEYLSGPLKVNSFEHEVFIISYNLAKERIPQLRKALQILEEHQKGTP